MLRFRRNSDSNRLRNYYTQKYKWMQIFLKKYKNSYFLLNCVLFLTDHKITILSSLNE